MGYVRHEGGVISDFLMDAEYELEIAAERVPCSIHRAPLYDPDMHRVRA
jgi:4-methylaminobutanoate oxidase (formaldehyde-forming)